MVCKVSNPSQLCEKLYFCQHASRLLMARTGTGAVLHAVTLLFYPMVVRRLGLKRSLVAGCLMMIVPTFLIPLVAYVPSHQLSTQLVLLAMCLGVKSAAQGVGFTSVLVLLNQSVRCL